MIEGLRNIFKIPELKSRILFTLAMILVFRVGCHIPTPGVDGKALTQLFEASSGTIFSLMDLFSGGALRRLSIFALGVMPYISASIIISLLAAVIPALEELQKEGEAGRRKITQYTRYGTVGLAIIQGLGIAVGLENPESFFGAGAPVLVPHPGWAFRLGTALTICAGSVFLMWVGEQITERGIGNGMSILIFAGIVARAPFAGGVLVDRVRNGVLKPLHVVVLLAVTLVVIAAVVLLTQGQRRITVQHAKRIVGRRVYSGQSTYLPLRVNQAGVIPIIFAAAILMFPPTIAARFGEAGRAFADMLRPGRLVYNVLYAIGIIFFTYFYTAIQFNTSVVADNMKKHGSFIPGIRPGRPTAEYLDKIMSRITFVGALGLTAIALFPRIVSAAMPEVPYAVSSFMGGTALIILVGVALDTARQIESHLLMRHYDGFMKRGRIRGR